MGRQCNKAIQFRGTTGAIISPAVSFLCSLPVDHSGPCMSPSLKRSVSERQRWERAQPQPSEPDLYVFADEEPPAGARSASMSLLADRSSSRTAAAPRAEHKTTVRCPECFVEVPAHDAVPHILTHRRHVDQAIAGAPKNALAVSVPEWVALQEWMSSAPSDIAGIWSRCAEFLLAHLGSGS